MVQFGTVGGKKPGIHSNQERARFSCCRPVNGNSASIMAAALADMSSCASDDEATAAPAVCVEDDSAAPRSRAKQIAYLSNMMVRKEALRVARQRRRWELMLRAAYDSRRRGVASAVLERSGRWLDTARAFVAAAFLWAQNKALGQLLVAAQQRPPSFTLLRLAWDETGQQMTLKSSATAQVMQVMQLRLALVVAWGPKTWSCKVCVPPQLVPGVSAEAIFDAMQSRTVAPILAAARSICNLAGVAVEVMETDAASGNEKLCAHLLRQSSSLWCWKQCSLHQHQLVQVQLLSLANGPGFNMLSRLFSITTFLHMGGTSPGWCSPSLRWFPIVLSCWTSDCMVAPRPVPKAFRRRCAPTSIGGARSRVRAASVSQRTRQRARHRLREVRSSNSRSSSTGPGTKPAWSTTATGVDLNVWSGALPDCAQIISARGLCCGAEIQKMPST